jgi:hypothetical protein
MKWSILTLTMPTRVEFLARLKNNLEPQLVDGVEWKIKMCDFNYSLGENREMMRRSAGGMYSNFVDDDDKISDRYVDRILPLLGDTDYIGFRLQAFENNVALPGPTYHSLLCGGWFDKTYADGTKSWHRDLSHLNPIRTELALSAPMYGGFGEDSRWAGDLRKLGIVKTEHFLEEIMYAYLSRTDKLDGVQVGPISAGKCVSCQSSSTVLVAPKMRFCNACGNQEALRE